VSVAERVVVYLTCADAEEARRIGRAVVADRLAACANVLPGHTAIYRWEGEIREEAEVAMLLKTRGDLVAPLIGRIERLHSYSVPCIVVLPIQAGNPAFLEWIGSETD